MIGEKQCIRGRRDLPTRGAGSSSGSDDGSLPSMTPEDRECLHAKMFLMKQRQHDMPSLYDHLSSLIATLLDGETNLGLSQLEEISETIKRERIEVPSAPLRDDPGKSHTENLAKAQWNLFKKMPQVGQNDIDNHFEESDGFIGVPDIVRHAAFFEMAGIGLPREEIIRMSLALTELMMDYPFIKSIRFWGKILGISRNYYIAETEFGEEEYEDDTSVTKEAEHDNDELPSELREEESSLFDDMMLPDDLKPMYKPPPKIPCEPAGSGLNKKVYFVTSEPGLPWVRLPHVTPAQIQVARKIRKFFTGNLDAQVVSYPPFPGIERNYLRAQIARISASTQISPLGYFRFDDETEEEEAAEETGEARGDIIIDTEFEGMSIKDLADGSLQAWVHHSPAILPQGRAMWWNPVQPKEEFNEDEEDQEDEDEERNEPDEPEPEVGPPLLTPLAEDDSVGNSPAWIACTSSKFIPEYAIALLQSNVWVGAMAFAADKGKFFENLYIGWGQKNLEDVFEPALPEIPLVEFPSGPEITEADDPTPEEEAAVRAALQEKELEAEFEQNMDDEDDDDIVDDDGEGGEQFD
ncbi:radial spoke head protein 6 homolog A-like [Mercenaria mercenaria]|uniref:radial spoke head protein 6 homolog A-like n=1 Tax=Mercenaria mercenaria TaxID=6596 RepID=UPI00234EDCBE|nr:radial spoke head protein 6 homolog A-like [Mercenaria mercenaria]